MSTKTILIIEDDPAILSLVRDILLQTGSYEVLCTQTAEEGLRVARELPRPIHLLLLNVILPGVLGTEVATEIKRSRDRLRIILLAGKAHEDLAVLQNGWHYLDKADIRTDLLARVKAEFRTNSATGR